MNDAAESGRSFRVLSVIDDYTRECLAPAADTGFAGRRVTRALGAILAERGSPQAIRRDNGPEFTSRYFLAWCLERGIELIHIEPGKPVENAHVESFHGRLREECLNVSWFGNLFEARRKIGEWREEYNQERPHGGPVPDASGVCAARADFARFLLRSAGRSQPLRTSGCRMINCAENGGRSDDA